MFNGRAHGENGAARADYFDEVSLSGARSFEKCVAAGRLLQERTGFD